MVTIPRRAKDMETTAYTALARFTRMAKRPVVAIVEDDEAMREALSDLLAALNLPYRTFDRAEVFLVEHESQQFDCLITDVRMPGINGLELQQRLRALGSSVPVIIITSSTGPTTRVRALEGGARAFLTKPVSNNVLIHHLKSALNWD
jgi:two-component system response regulator FixJ